MRTSPGPPNTPALRYETILSYFNLPDSSSTYGYKLGPNDDIHLTLDGSFRIYAIASSASANVLTLEIV